MDALQKIIRQAELQKLQLTLSDRYTRNIAVFAKKFPTIANKFVDYTAKNITLRVDSRDEINLVDTRNNTFLYSDSPTEYCKEQVKLFKSKPFVNRLRMGKSKAYNESHIHIKYMNTLIENLEEIKAKKFVEPSQTMRSLIISSVGIGYHIPGILADLNVFNIVIYENNLDFFYASLHTLEWQPILDYFSKPHHSITFCLGVKPTIALAQIEKSVDTLGLHNLMQTHIYRHTKSKEEFEFIQLYLNQISTNLGGLGFFDDEQIGLAHTMENLRAAVPVFIHKSRKNNKLPPVLVIGNGPSLDEHAEFIINNKDKAIIMSCGSSFGSLIKLGIKPDFHVEMERTISMKDLLDFGTTEKDREGVTLLCLNTVAPQTIQSFSDNCMAQKPNDVGEDILDDIFKPQKIVKLLQSNPTVSNCALSFSIELGFKEVYLIGVDLGLRDDGQHHSENSPHYDIDKHIKDADEAIYTYDDENQYVPGNFGGKVKTHAILNRARVSIERLLYLTSIAHPDFNCYNPNNGAFIQGAATLSTNDIPAFEKIDKPKLISQIKEDNFHTSNNEKKLKKIQKSQLKHFFSIEKKVSIPQGAYNIDSLHNELQRIYNTVSNGGNAITNLLLRGSINCFFGLMSQHTFQTASPVDLEKMINLAINTYNDFITDIYQSMRENPYRLDDTHNVTIKRLKTESNEKEKEDG